MSGAKFVSFSEVARLFKGKTVAIVGSAPSCAENAPGFIDSHDLVVRVNNYKTGPGQGFRTDVHYSFYGRSIRKTRDELIADGVRLCMCKCPNAKCFESDWHQTHDKENGVDYRYIYRDRREFWFCDTYVPDLERFFDKFYLLGDGHQPTTGFAAILDVLDCEPRRVYLTGFDFFTSGKHNVNETWRPVNPLDPIRHRPDLEMAWLRLNLDRYRVSLDAKLEKMLTVKAAA
jgi:hypothetical protein